MADESLKQAKIMKAKNYENNSNTPVSTPINEEIKKDKNKANEEKSADGKKGKEEKKEKKEQKVKKTEAKVYGRSVSISLKQASAIGRFIKYRKIEDAIKMLENVIKKKTAVPFKGEVAHRKGKGMMSGKYPVKTSKEFIRLLKTLSANCNVNGLDIGKTIISEVIVNKAPKHYHRFGSTMFKRTHVSISAKEASAKSGGKN